MNTSKEARRDANEFARAQMFYGEGAGTRRKLIQATVQSKALHDPAYASAFNNHIVQQDMAEHASKARRERKLKDTSYTVSKNARAIATGNHQGANTIVLVVFAVGAFAHKTGLDQKAQEKAKELNTRFKAFRKERKARNRVFTIVKDI